MNPAATATTNFRTTLRDNDEQAIRAIVDRTAFFRPDEIDVAAELARERLARGPDSGYEFVLADDQQHNLIAYACFGPIACTIGAFDLYWIVVDPSAQSRGLGRALVRAVEQRAAELNARAIYIETSSTPQYAPTRAFYDRCGYTIEARLKDFYRPADDKLIYIKRLA